MGIEKKSFSFFLLGSAQVECRANKVYGCASVFIAQRTFRLSLG